MQWMRQLSVFVVLAIFLGVNVGVGIYTHTCSMEGVERSYLIPGEDPCEDIHTTVSSACCDESEEHAETKNCCSTDTEYVQLDVDATTHDASVQFFIAPVILANASSFLPEVQVSERHLAGAHCIHPPPKYQGRDFQCIHQVYRL